jgi:hypothetical protein
MLEDYFNVRMTDPVDTVEAVGTFQRMCLTGSEEEAWEATKMWFKPQCRTVIKDSPEAVALTAVHRLAKQDVLGQGLDALVRIVSRSGGADKDKLAAATILNELYGEKEITSMQGVTDRLIMNLVPK